MRLIDADALKSLFDERYDSAFMQMHTRDNKAYWNGVCAGVNWGRNTIADATTIDAVILPCKPLDTVYFIECRTDGNHKIRSGFALSVEYHVGCRPIITIRYNDNTLETTKHFLGMKAFMTREEAEAALAERMKKDA